MNAINKNAEHRKYCLAIAYAPYDSLFLGIVPMLRPLVMVKWFEERVSVTELSIKGGYNLLLQVHKAAMDDKIRVNSGSVPKFQQNEIIILRRVFGNNENRSKL